MHFDDINRYLNQINVKFKNRTALDTAEIAALCFASGVLLQMDYTSSGSASSLTRSRGIFKDTLGYQHASTRRISKDDSLFLQNIFVNIMNGYPVILGLQGDGRGHAVIVDGYNTSGFLHYNWGAGDSYPDKITDVWFTERTLADEKRKNICDCVYNISPGTIRQCSDLTDTTDPFFAPATVLNHVSDVFKIILTNPDADPVHIFKIAVSGGYELSQNPMFFGDQVTDAHIGSGEALPLYVRFTPDTIGLNPGTIDLWFTDGSAYNYQQVQLCGYGIPSKGTAIYGKEISGKLDRASSPYFIFSDVTIAEDSTLLIEPGTEIIIMKRYCIYILDDSRFLANGTESDSIYFSAYHEAVGWPGFTFRNSGNDDTLSHCVITGCRFDKNEGNALTIASSSPVITHSKIADNSSKFNCSALCLQYSRAEIRHCRIENNLSMERGGAIYIKKGSPVISHVIIAGNKAQNGGAIYVEDSSPELSHLTIVLNEAIGSGSALYFTGRNQTAIKNSIIWNNRSSSGDVIAFDYNPDPDSFSLVYSNIDTSGQYWLSTPANDQSSIQMIKQHGNISMKPQFADMEKHNFQLSSDSPCIDRGDSEDDIGMEPFPHGYCVNMGAYGGTSRSAKTMKPSLTISPSYIDLSSDKSHEIIERKCYLKNGSANAIQISGITLSHPGHLTLKDFHYDKNTQDRVLTLPSGSIDSFTIVIDKDRASPGDIRGSFSVQSRECPDKTVGVLVNDPDVSISPLSCQAPEILWAREYRFEQDMNILGSKFTDMHPTADEGFVLTGYVVQKDSGYDVLLAKVDAHGDIVWHQIYGGSGCDMGFRMNATSDGGYIIVGTTNSFGNGDKDVYVIKTDAFGDTVFTRTYDNSPMDQGSSIFESAEGGYIIGAVTSSGGSDGKDICILKTDSRGYLKERKVLNHPGDQGIYDFKDKWDNSLPNLTGEISPDGDGFIMVTCTHSSPDCDWNIWILKFDSNADTVWTKHLGGLYNENAPFLSIRNCSDHGYIVTASTRSFGMGTPYHSNALLTKMDTQGEIEWMRAIGDENENQAWDGCQTSDGGYIFCGISCPLSSDRDNTHLVRMDADGDTLWTLQFREDAQSAAIRILQLEGGEYVIAGYASTSGNVSNAFLMKVDAEDPDAVAIDNSDVHSNTPESVRLQQNYPNPFNQSTVIQYALPSGGHVTLSIYNGLGQIVCTLVDEFQERGHYSIPWHPAGSASGLYYYRLCTGGRVWTKKMLLIK